MNPLQETLLLFGAARVGSEIRAKCPLCQCGSEDAESEDYFLSINPGEQKVLVFRCWRCEYNRAFFPRVCDLLGLDKEFLAAPRTQGEVAALWAEVGVESIASPDCPDPADPDTLHAVYTALLDHLELHAHHRNWLKQRGRLDPDWAEAAGYRSSPDQPNTVAETLGVTWGRTLLRVPGFTHGRLLTRSSAILTPCRDYHGRIAALKQRLLDGKRGRIRLLSSVTEGGPKALSITHCPLGVGGHQWPRVWITEGERKADQFWTSQGEPVVALPGVAQWRSLLSVLSKVLQPGGEAVLAMDRDSAGQKCERELAPILAEAGYRTLQGCWAGGPKLDEGTDFRVEEIERSKPVNPNTKARKLRKHLRDSEIVDWIRSNGPVLRTQVPAYSPSISRLIRAGALRMEKTDRGQLLTAKGD